MITAQIDYQNLQFMVFDNGQLQDNPLLVEVQRVVIEQIIYDCAERICRGLKEQRPIEPYVLRQALVN